MSLKKYQIIYADPPWEFKSNSKLRPGRNVRRHYPTMSIEDIKRIDVRSIASNDSVLFLWATFPVLHKAFEVIEAWGFKYKTVAFVWLKLRKKAIEDFKDMLKHFIYTQGSFWAKYKHDLEGKDISNYSASFDSEFSKFIRFLLVDAWHMGMGYYTRANAEICLLGVRGKPLKRVSRSVPQVIIAPVEHHSKKPSVVRYRITELFGDIPRIELFAREKPDGWDVWGNEVEPDIELGFIPSLEVFEK